MRIRPLLVCGLIASCSCSSHETPFLTPDQRATPVASDERCEGVRDLMLDTVVHQLLAGGYPAPMPPGAMQPMPPEPREQPKEESKASDAAPPPASAQL